MPLYGWLPTHVPHLSFQFRVFSPNQGSSPEPTNIFISLPFIIPCPSSHGPTTLTLDFSSPSPGPSSQVLLQETLLGLSSLRVFCFTPRMMEARKGPQSPGQVKGQSWTPCWVLSPFSAPKLSPSCSQVPVRHRSPSSACPHPRCGGLPT